MKLSSTVMIFSFISIIMTLSGTFILLTQKGRRKRDKILLYNNLTIDVWVFIFAICIGGTESKRIFSNLYMFMFLLSWSNQALVTINIYKTIHFLLKYEIIRYRSKLDMLVEIVCTAVSSFIVSCTFGLSYFSMLAGHSALLFVTYAIEFLLLRTAKDLQKKYCLITHACVQKYIPQDT